LIVGLELKNLYPPSKKGGDADQRDQSRDRMKRRRDGWQSKSERTAPNDYLKRVIVHPGGAGGMRIRAGEPTKGEGGGRPQT